MLFLAERTKRRVGERQPSRCRWCSHFGRAWRKVWREEDLHILGVWRKKRVRRCVYLCRRFIQSLDVVFCLPTCSWWILGRFSRLKISSFSSAYAGVGCDKNATFDIHIHVSGFRAAAQTVRFAEPANYSIDPKVYGVLVVACEIARLSVRGGV